MRILFLCGSLEPSFDGVGDYTRRMAAALIRQGHSSAIISLNDRYLRSVYSGVQVSTGVEVSVQRLPSGIPEKARYKMAFKWTESFAPDRICLQFVPYSFNKRGLPFTLTRRLLIFQKGRLGGKTPEWHIMFHELWVGMQKSSSWRHILTGNIQRDLIRTMVRKLQPALIETHSEVYSQHLAHIGIKCGKLPLISTIPKTGCRTSRINGEIKLVIFGSIHPHSQVRDFTEELAHFAKTKKLRVHLDVIGRSGSERDTWLRFWIKNRSGVFKVEVHGDYTEAFISQKLSEADFGISTCPYALAEKSSSIAAMIEHGILVICIGEKWESRLKCTGHRIKGIIPYKKGNISNCLDLYLHRDNPDNYLNFNQW